VSRLRSSTVLDFFWMIKLWIALGLIAWLCAAVVGHTRLTSRHDTGHVGFTLCAYSSPRHRLSQTSTSGSPSCRRTNRRMFGQSSPTRLGAFRSAGGLLSRSSNRAFGNDLCRMYSLVYRMSTSCWARGVRVNRLQEQQLLRPLV
jgi:hypothetical protein